MYLIFLDKKKKSSILLFLKVLLPFFIFFSLSTWVFANPCEEAFSSGAGEIFISFVKKQMGKKFETELPANWSDKIVEKTKHWTREEALQFLDFLINRSGELSTVEHLESLADLSSTISFKDFMNKVNFYDRINKDIIDELLNREREEFEFLLTNNDVNTVKIQQLNQIIENYIGKTGASYVMRDLILDRGDELNNSNPREIRKVINFVDYYTKKHGVVTDTLDNRVDFFRQFISLPRKQQKSSNIRFGDFSELKEFSKLISEALKEREREIITEGKTTALKEIGAGGVYALKRIGTLPLQYLIRIKIINLLSVYYDLQLSDLKKIIRVFERYITPAEVAYMLVNKPDIFTVNPKHLRETINILERYYNVSLFLQTHVDKTLIVGIDVLFKEQNVELTAQRREEAMKLLNKTPKKFISYIIKTKAEQLLSTNPTHLKGTLTILENYISKTGVAFILRIGYEMYEGFDLLITNPNYLQKIISVLEKYFEKNEMIAIIGDHFSAMGKIKDSDVFTEIVETLSARIDQQSIFLQRIRELFDDIGYYPFHIDLVILEIRDELVKMSNTLDYRQMKKILENTYLSKFSPLMQEIKDMEEE